LRSPSFLFPFKGANFRPVLHFPERQKVLTCIVPNFLLQKGSPQATPLCEMAVYVFVSGGRRTPASRLLKELSLLPRRSFLCNAQLFEEFRHCRRRSNPLSRTAFFSNVKPRWTRDSAFPSIKRLFTFPLLSFALRAGTLSVFVWIGCPPVSLHCH